jgi:hypothetical protein
VEDDGRCVIRHNIGKDKQLWHPNMWVITAWYEAYCHVEGFYAWLIRRVWDWMIGFTAPYTFTTRKYR